MALITAKATGNWSAGSTWDSDPALPAAGDTVDCAGYTVTIDQDVAVTQIKSTAAGYFAVTDARNITAAILSDTGHSGGGVVRCTHAMGTVAITGSVTAGPSRGVDNQAAGTLIVTGNVAAGSATGAYGVNNNSTGTVTITGNVVGGSGSSARGAYNNVGGVITITGSATGGSGSTAHGAQNNGLGTLTVNGACVSGSNIAAFGVYGNNAAGATLIKQLRIGGAVGCACGGYCKILVDPSNNYMIAPRSDTGADYYLSNDYPTEAQVESGVVYKLTTQTGTMVGGRPAFGDRTGGKW